MGTCSEISVQAPGIGFLERPAFRPYGRPVDIELRVIWPRGTAASRGRIPGRYRRLRAAVYETGEQDMAWEGRRNRNAASSTPAVVGAAAR